MHSNKQNLQYSPLGKVFNDNKFKATYKKGVQ